MAGLAIVGAGYQLRHDPDSRPRQILLHEIRGQFLWHRQLEVTTGAQKSATGFASSIVAALPVFVTAVYFAVPAVSDDVYLPGSDSGSLTRAMQIEFLLVGGGLLFIPPLFMPARTLRGHHVRAVLLALLAAAFAWGAWDLDGWRGLGAFVLLLYVSYGGATLFSGGVHRRNALGMMAAARWFMCLPVFFGVVVALDLGGSINHWRNDPEVIHLGAVFFSYLFVLELVLFGRVQRYVMRQLEALEDPDSPHALRSSLAARRQRFYANIVRRNDQGREQ